MRWPTLDRIADTIIETDLPPESGVGQSASFRVATLAEIVDLAGGGTQQGELTLVAYDGFRATIDLADVHAHPTEPTPDTAAPCSPHRVHDQIEGTVQQRFQVVRGTRVLIGMLPSGLGPTGTTPHFSLFYSLRADRLEEHRASDFSKWKASVLSDALAAAAVLEHLRSHDDLLFSEYHVVVMWPWNVGRLSSRPPRLPGA